MAIKRAAARPAASVLSVLVAAVICLWVPASAAAVEDEYGAWLVFSMSGNMPTQPSETRWRFWTDAQARYVDFGSGSNQWLIRPAIGYQLRGSVQGWLGYARFRSRGRSGNVVHENRYWQQVNWTAGRLYGGAITMRARLEQRSVSSGDDLGLVLRFLTSYTRPLGTGDRTYLAVKLEPFFVLSDTDWAGSSGLRQHRTAIGIGFRLSERMTLEAGYMNQYISADVGSDRSNHLAVLNFKMKL